ncbi:epoxide hydrolase [Rhodococcoides trifolii]|uniref:Epoxide hydrolase n=1 Tax=Rhodococcoides trifolii TaxID=908250 RepID=A0A917FSI3_9NOCA|nr:alpha/beta hydrolase [Rhodococcus trifolii]GGG01687.1 epoxide hydrolase [Rhodococcus trifolii]
MRIPLGDLTFDVDTHGPDDGTPVVLLHGWPATSASWNGVVDALAPQKLRLIVPNQRGYSPDARPTAVDDYRLDHLVDDVIGLLDFLKIPAITLVGHDWGSVVAWAVAARHPDRVNSLVTVSVPHPGAYGWALAEDEDQRRRGSYMKLLRQPGKAEDVLLEDDCRRLRAMFDGARDPSIVDAYLPVVGTRDGLTAGLNWYRAMTKDFANLPAVTVPTTFVWSTGDTAIGRAGVERCHEWVDAEYRFVELDGSHWVPEDSPREVAAAIVHRIG